MFNSSGDMKEIWLRDGKISRDGDLPARIYYQNGKVVNESWYKDGILCRDDKNKPIMIGYHNGAVEYRRYRSRTGHQWLEIDR
jgi:hypothetical protein